MIKIAVVRPTIVGVTIRIYLLRHFGRRIAFTGFICLRRVDGELSSLIFRLNMRRPELPRMCECIKPVRENKMLVDANCRDLLGIIVLAQRRHISGKSDCHSLNAFEVRKDDLLFSSEPDR